MTRLFPAERHVEVVRARINGPRRQDAAKTSPPSPGAEYLRGEIMSLLRTLIERIAMQDQAIRALTAQAEALMASLDAVLPDAVAPIEELATVAASEEPDAPACFEPAEAPTATPPVEDPEPMPVAPPPSEEPAPTRRIDIVARELARGSGTYHDLAARLGWNKNVVRAYLHRLHKAGRASYMRPAEGGAGIYALVP